MPKKTITHDVTEGWVVHMVGARQEPLGTRSKLTKTKKKLGVEKWVEAVSDITAQLRIRPPVPSIGTRERKTKEKKVEKEAQTLVLGNRQ